MSLCSTLYSILSGKDNYCCLCLKTVEENARRLQDKIVFQGLEEPLGIDEILSCILGNRVTDIMSSTNTVCHQCQRSAIACYKFINMCTGNCEYLQGAIETLTNSLGSFTSGDIMTYKSLFILINGTDASYSIYCDKKKLRSSQDMVWKRFKSMIKREQRRPKIDIDFEPDHCYSPTTELDPDGDGEDHHTNTETPQKKRRKHCPTSIPTTEMMYTKGMAMAKCKVCLKTYSSLGHLRQHFIRVHAPKKFRCPKCPRSYGSQTLLEQHKLDSHSPVVCSTCGKSYVNRYTLAIHEAGHRQKITCNNCGRSYKNRSTYNKHIQLKICQQTKRKSNSEAKLTCDHCQKRFTHKPSLRVHMQFEHGNGKVFTCTWCNKKFHAPSKLTAHIVKHTQEKKFNCPLCGGKFVTKESLLYHTRIHTGEKPYKCHLCDSSFLSTSRRAEHVRRHHNMGGPTLECDICNSKFKGRSVLTKHKKRHFNPKSRLHCSQTDSVVN